MVKFLLALVLGSLVTLIVAYWPPGAAEDGTLIVKFSVAVSLGARVPVALSSVSQSVISVRLEGEIKSTP